MNELALVARPCRCERPLLDADTCLRCGRWLTAEPGLERRPPHARHKPAWTRAGVVRALRAFTFFRGRAPVRADWTSSMGTDWPTFGTVERLFGSLPAALKAAGIDDATRDGG